MAWVMGGKHFGQYTYEHWFDDEYDELKATTAQTAGAASVQDSENESSSSDSNNTAPGTPQRQP
jgi:hypothetical protein